MILEGWEQGELGRRSLDKHHLIDNSIGQFGIGMKRAFFKLGSNIHVKSVAATSEFELTIDVPNWLKEPNVWEFEFDKNTLKEKQ